MPYTDPRLVQMLGTGAGPVSLLFDTMPEAIGVLWPVRDDAGTIIDFETGYTNPGGDDMMGFPMRPEFGTRVLVAFPSLVEMGVFDRLVRVVETGVGETAEIEMIGLWRGTAPMSGIYDHSLLPFGEGVLSLAYDLTAERRREAELQDFAAVAAHDLRDPLLGLNLVITMLARRRDRFAQEERELVERVQEGVDRAQALVAGMLEYAATSADMDRSTEVDCGEAVAEAVASLGALVEEAGATIEVLSLPVVRANHHAVCRVFQNLLGNALKYRSADPPHIVVSAAPLADAWIFTVTDNGIGVEADSAVFDMFVRGHDRGATGTGIGLAVCRRIVEAHNGRIWVDPVPAGGSAFSFTLPAG